MTPRAAPDHLLRLAGGQPFVLVAEGVADPSSAGSGALETWLASACDGALMLHPLGTPAPAFAETVALDAPPAGALAVVAAPGVGGALVAGLSRWWSGHLLGARLPVVPAQNGRDALPGLLALMAGALATAWRREAARPATGGMAAPTRLMLSGQPGGPPLAGGGCYPLPIALPGIAAIGLHVAGTGTDEGVLRLRLLSAAGRRVLGAWVVPAPALAPGWLALDLPGPLGPVAETGLLEIVPEGPGVPPLSREARPGASGDPAAPALRAWAAPPSAAMVHPSFWAPEEVGLPWVAPGTELLLPKAAWAAARVLAGRLDPVAIGDEAPRLLLRAPAGQRAAVLLTQIHLAGISRIGITLEAAGGEGAAVAAWIRPPEESRFDGDALDRPAPGAAWTGWREPLDGTAVLSLPVSARLGGRGSLVIGLSGGGHDAAAEIEGVRLSAGPLEAVPDGNVPTLPPARPGPAAEPGALPARAVRARPPLPRPALPGVTGAMLRRGPEPVPPASASPGGAGPAEAGAPGATRPPLPRSTAPR